MNGCDLKFIKPRAEPEKLNLLDLPAIKLVTRGIINVLFARPLTTGNEAKDEELKRIIYTVNRNGRTGLDEIKDAYLYSSLYGKGLLVFNPIAAQLYSVSPFRYQPYYFKENNLVKYVVMYKIFDEESSTIYRAPIKVSNKYENLVTEQNTQGFFITEKLCTEFFEMLNPLEADRKRAEILLTMLNEILSDIRTGGYGHVLLFGNKSYIAGDEEVSDAEAFTRQADLHTIEGRKAEVKEMLDDIVQGARKGGSYFDGWVEKVEQLKRAVTPKDYEYFILKSQQITCEIIGIPPVLLGLNETSKNVSIEHLLKQANEFFTMPERQKLENYVSKVLSPYLGVEKVYFEEEPEEEETLTNED